MNYHMHAVFLGLSDAFKPLKAPDAGFAASFSLGYSVTVLAGFIWFHIELIVR